MPLPFFATMVIGQGTIRMLAAACVVAFLTKLYLRGKFVQGMYVYWLGVHLLGAWFTAMVVIQYSQGLTLFGAVPYVAVGFVFYGLVYVVPPYRSTGSFTYLQVEKPDWHVEKIQNLLLWRQRTALWGIVGYAGGLLGFSFFPVVPKIAVLSVEILLGIPWLYYMFAVWGAVLVVLSAYYVLKWVYSLVNMQLFRKRLEKRLGHASSEEEFLEAYMTRHLKEEEKPVK